jgi:hypothetical protein
MRGLERTVIGCLDPSSGPLRDHRRWREQASPSGKKDGHIRAQSALGPGGVPEMQNMHHPPDHPRLPRAILLLCSTTGHAASANHHPTLNERRNP